MLTKFSGVETERSVSKFRKRKRKFLCFVHLPYSIKQEGEIRKFHVAIVQRRLRIFQVIFQVIDRFPSHSMPIFMKIHKLIGC